MAILNFRSQKQFEKDLVKVKKRGKDMAKIEGVITQLINVQPLPPKNREHKLQGNFKDFWECHIEPDWLLIYKKTPTEIILIRTGTHSDLF
ncbi:MAG TPA: type II toxin-antitoxin system YafQ family toxin [Candidatus Babeliales bacterium]|nr:type II toxin-antitoxin system YafQ family toxin [Candidatus Babeliales bacterium]